MSEKHRPDAHPELGPELANAVAAGGGEPLTLLVEVDLPEPRVRLRTDETGGRRRVAPMGFHPVTDDESAERERIIAATRVRLEKLLSEPPKWLPAAHAFIVRVEPARVAELAACEHVRAVRLSRRRSPASGG